MDAPPANVCLMSCADGLQKPRGCGKSLPRGEYLFRNVRGVQLNRSAGPCTADDGSTVPAAPGDASYVIAKDGKTWELEVSASDAPRRVAPFWLAAALAAACALAAFSRRACGRDHVARLPDVAHVN